MTINCIWEHNGNDTLLYAVDYVGAYTRGESLDIAKAKMPAEISSYLKWCGGNAVEDYEIVITDEKVSNLNIKDADSDVLFESEKSPLTLDEYEKLKALALKSAKDFLALYESIPDKRATAVPERKTFYGNVPRSADEMYEHTKNVTEYYFTEIDVHADNNGNIYECRKHGFEQLAKIENESDRVNRTYDIFNEDSRLNHSKAARVEFVTTVHYIEKYLKGSDKILDIGAGAGEYSLYFARKGYEVSALELADANIAAFKKKITPEDKIDLVQGNALDLSRYADKSFDIVLLFGPLYHLKNDIDKLKCISEAKRVCKDDGKIFFAFISNDFVFLTEFGYDANYFGNGDYDKETFKLNDFPFVFHTVDAARKLLADGGINVLHEVASDGASELLAARINEMPDEDYAQYLRYHFYICEKPELLGMSNHFLFVGEKK